MLPRSGKDKRIDQDCPPDLVRQVDVTLAAALAGQGIMMADRLGDLVARHCPEIFALTQPHGFELRFDLAENTHSALRKGRFYYRIRKRAH